jgi:hypothetical protein
MGRMTIDRMVRVMGMILKMMTMTENIRDA